MGKATINKSQPLRKEERGAGRGLREGVPFFCLANLEKKTVKVSPKREGKCFFSRDDGGKFLTREKRKWTGPALG